MDSKAFASEFRDLLKKRNVNLKPTLLPYNRFKIEDTLWWILPVSGQNTGFQYGKYFFLNKDDKIVSGIHIERGALPETKGTYDKKYTLSNDWAWNTLIQDFQDGTADSILKQICKNISSPMVIKIDIGVLVPDPHPDMPRPECSHFKFEYNGAELKLIEKIVREDYLEQIFSSNNLIELGDKLKGNQVDKFSWIDLYVGVEFNKSDSSTFELDGLNSLIFTQLEKWFF